MTIHNTGQYVFSPANLRIARYQGLVPVSRVLADYPDALALLDGPMFQHTASRTCGTTPWDTCFRLYDKGAELDEPTQMPSAGMTISVVNGRALALHGEAVAPGATVAVQLYPTLVWEGQSQASNEAVSSGAGVGILRDGRLIFMVGGGGSLADLADAMIGQGVVYGGYTDGGSSTALYARSQGWVGVHAAGAAGPKLPTWLIAQKPTLGAQLASMLPSGWAVGISLAAVGAYILWRTTRKTGPVANRRHRNGPEEFKIGFSWKAAGGSPGEIVTKTVERLDDFRGEPACLVRKSSGLSEIIKLADLPREVDRDTKNLVSRRLAWAQVAGEETADKTTATADGFERLFTPLRASKVMATLNQNMIVRGSLGSRKDHIRGLVNEGFRVLVTPKGERLFEHSDGRFFTQADLTKTGLDFAEFLVEQKVGNRRRRVHP